MTDQHVPLDTIAEFYDSLSADYDVMTEFPKRFVRERPFFHMLVDKHRIRTALDAGSGTGFHSLLLAQLGVDVTAVDVSPKMIGVVRKHAKTMGLKVKTRRTGFGEMAEKLRGPFDAVFCLGNSLAHAASLEELRSWLVAFSSVLRSGGMLILQVLNYEPILSERRSIPKKRTVGGKTFVRFHTYDAGRIVFNLVTSDEKESGNAQGRRALSLLPVLGSDLIPALTSAGFGDIRSFGGISLGAFLPKSSADLVILARRRPCK
jgi:2-polyprenyl-3-methyl-5-hydroxy-6-metoxy-1,4-benzoquinol methylase